MGVTTIEAGRAVAPPLLGTALGLSIQRVSFQLQSLAAGPFALIILVTPLAAIPFT